MERNHFHELRIIRDIFLYNPDSILYNALPYRNRQPDVETSVDSPIRIALCMGSSCFARGNNRVLDVLERVIEENGWKDKVHLSGLRCQNHCAYGPNLTIDGDLYQGLDSGALLDLLAHKLGVDTVSATVSSVRRQDGGR